MIIYQDDILIMSSSFDEHLELVEKVLHTLLNNGIKIQVSKCEFFKTEVTFLGHIISRKGIKKSPAFINKISEYPKPVTVTQLRQFLGLANFQRKFIDKFSIIARPLTELTGGPKRKKLTWSNEMEEAFKILKQEMAKDLALAFPDYSPGAQPLELFVDASEIGAGACLIQKQEGEYRPIAYSSTAFSKTERNYATINRELLALRWGIKYFRAFLFGVRFYLYTDHKPLLYLYNMSRDNAKLMRIITELEDYNFVIKYRPGAQNQAADAMSRIMTKANMEDSEDQLSNDLPKGFKVMEKIEGGGDTMFKSLQMVLEELKHLCDDLSIPKDHEELRKEVVNHLMTYPSRFNLKLDKIRTKELRAMQNIGILPCEETLLAAADLFKIQIWTHHGMPSPVVYRTETDTENREVHVQCIAGIHFNPVIKVWLKPDIKLTNKNVNIILEDTNYQDSTEPATNNSDSMIQIYTQIEELEKHCDCNHDVHKMGRYVATVGNTSFCAVLDTGAQVSVISNNLWEKLENDNFSLIKEECTGQYIAGIGSKRIEVIGIAHLKPRLLDIEVDHSIPFAILVDDCMPCCCILGTNFMTKNKIVMDFNENVLYSVNFQGDAIIYPFPNNRNADQELLQVRCDEIGSTCLETSDEEDSDKSSRDESIPFARYKLQGNIMEIQKENHSITTMFKKVKDQISGKEWEEKFLIQFRRYAHQLFIEKGMLIRKTANYQSTVVPFLLMVEIVVKTHQCLGHIGRNKLADVVLKRFWHPSLDKICRDVCNSCPHCQLVKVSKITARAPTLKIETQQPFQLVAMDCMVLEKSRRNNIGIVVAIDHFSKWMTAIPIKDKRGGTMSRILEQNILPNLISIPQSILTDNGTEFKCQEFNEILEKYNIKHAYSTPYKASSNGCVERSNRTIIQLLKGIQEGDKKDWDNKLSRAIIIHNTTVSATTGESPSDKILKYEHNVQNLRHPINTDLQSTWKVGHPKFAPFKVGQKVLKKIQRIGRRLVDKLQPRFEGPYEIIRTQSNNLTYEIRLSSSPDSQVKKAHYNYLKLFIEPPEYLKEFVQLESHEELEESSEESSSECDNICMGDNVPSSEESCPSNSGQDCISKSSSDNELSEQETPSNTKTDSEDAALSIDKLRHKRKHKISRPNRETMETMKDRSQVASEILPLENLPCSQIIGYELTAASTPTHQRRSHEMERLCLSSIEEEDISAEKSGSETNLDNIIEGLIKLDIDSFKIPNEVLYNNDSKCSDNTDEIMKTIAGVSTDSGENRSIEEIINSLEQHISERTRMVTNDENSFEGYQPDSEIIECAANKLKTLNELRNKSRVLTDKQINQDEEDFIDEDETSLIGSTEDITGGKSRSNDEGPYRNTRSKSVPMQLSNVQSKVLERKS